MAKVSAVNRNNKRKKLAKSLAGKRAKLKEIISNRETSMEERFAAVLKLAEMPRNSAENRQRNRCALTGRPRGHYRKFNLSRIALRDLASRGELPGVTKSSW
jgi:small subunit ribosomal protein S14